MEDGERAPGSTPAMVARPLLLSAAAAPFMIAASGAFALLLEDAGISAARLAVWCAGIWILQLVIGTIALVALRRPADRRGRGLNAVMVAAAASSLLCGVASVLMAPPAGRPEVAFYYQLWVAGTAAASMAIASAMTRVFVVSSGLVIVVNTALLATGLAGAPRLFAVPSLLYLVVLTLCHVVQRSALLSAVANEQRAHALLERLADANDQLQREASFDFLTGIANRRRILDALSHDLAQVGDGHEVDVMFIDLDGFKDVNDTFGHAVGDELLVAAARRITEHLTPHDLVGRQGGDEFIVLLRGVSPAVALARAEEIRSSLETSFRIGEHLIAVSASVGVVRCDQRELAPDDVLREADLALYRAKDHGRNCVVEHRREGSFRVDERSRTVSVLRDALRQQAIKAYFQPIVDMATGEIIGAEALARWERPDGTVAMPGEFLGMLTDAGLDTDLGIHMALQIIDYRSAIAEIVPEPFRLGLNVTLRRTRAKDLVDAFAAMQGVLTPTGAPAIAGMTIELTENAAVRDIDELETELGRLRALGVRVALDDFGTGHASLSLVRRLPLDVIKVDRCFVSGVAHDRTNRAVVAAVVEIAGGIGARVVAEGVECHADAIELQSLGCRFAQGFLYSPAVPRDLLTRWLTEGAPWQATGGAGAVEPAASARPLRVSPR